MKIDHIGLAVRSIAEALPFYRDVLGLRVTHREEVAAQRVRVAFLEGAGEGGCSVELLEPIDPQGPVGRFLAARGPGMHHLAFRTGGLKQEMSRLKRLGHPPLEESPRPGARGHQVCFIHPKHCGGVLLELVGS